MSYKEEILTLITIHPNMTNSEISQLVGCTRALVNECRKSDESGVVDTKEEALKRYLKRMKDD